MPIYEYRCEKDGHTFEVMQRFSDDPVQTCEVCGAPVQRVFHPVAVHFKGKGFYNTDYGTRKRARELKDSAEGSNKSDSDQSSEPTSKPDKSETAKPKTETKADSKSKSDTKAAA